MPSMSSVPWSPGITAVNTYSQSIVEALQRQIEAQAAELARLQRGLTQDKFNSVHDADLILELIARGYVVHKPLEDNDASQEGSSS
jgi:hypothetical protein